jgi:transketolase
MAAHKFQLDHLVAIVDQNGYQQTGATKVVMDMTPLAPKWQAFGWSVQEINGNDMKEALAALEKTKQVKGQPSVIISKTRKGWPIQDLIHDPNHHGKPLTPEQAKQAIAYIDAH